APRAGGGVTCRWRRRRATCCSCPSAPPPRRWALGPSGGGPTGPSRRASCGTTTCAGAASPTEATAPAQRSDLHGPVADLLREVVDVVRGRLEVGPPGLGGALE